MKKRMLLPFVILTAILITSACAKKETVTKSDNSPAQSDTVISEAVLPSPSADVHEYTLLYSIKDGTATVTGHTGAIYGTLYIPETHDNAPVTAVGDKAFSDCELMTGAEMPSVTEIGEEAFHFCTKLSAVSMPNVKKIGKEAFAGCIEIVTAYMPYAEDIGTGAFYNCEKLSEVDMTSVKKIGENAFIYCESIKTANMPVIEEIGPDAFRECSSLEKVYMPDVKSVGGSAFSYCMSLNSFIVAEDNGNYTADGGILYTKDKETLLFYPGAYGDIVIDEKVLTISAGAFSHTPITGIEMPGVKTIEGGAFYDCESLEYATMPSVNTIGVRAFKNCDALPSLDLPSVTEIAGEAFDECYSLAEINFPHLKKLGEYVFYRCSVKSFGISDANKTFYADGAILYSKDRKTIVAYPSASEKVVLDKSVRTIGKGAFAFTFISSIEMPGVTTVEDSAFYKCYELSYVKMPKVKALGDYAFSHCESLYDVEMPENVKIGMDAFACTLIEDDYD